MGRRRQARESALHALYLADLAPEAAVSAFESAVDGSDADEKTLAFCRELVDGVLASRQNLDERIEEAARNWSLARMAAVDRNLLRLAAFELFYRKATPPKVVIDEAIEIARKYSTEDSTRFINGILDKLKERSCADGAAEEIAD